MPQMRLPLLLLLLPALALSQTVAGTVVALPCSPSDTTQTAWTVNNGGIGVISIPGAGCLNTNGEGQSLDVRTCVGGDANEIGYNLTSNATAPSAVAWASSGLCLALMPTSSSSPLPGGGGAAPVPAPLTLSPCSPTSSPAFFYSPSNKSILLYPQPPSPSPPSSSPLCLALHAPPAPLLSTVFGSHMVFQHDEPFSLWGSAAPGSAVNVTVALSSDPLNPVLTASSTPDPTTGLWVASFPVGRPVGGPYTINVTSSSSPPSTPPTSLVDVFFGLVLVASGQSNLSGGNTPLSYVFNATQEIAESADFPSVRIFTVGTYSSGTAAPLPFLEHAPRIPWSVASPSTTPPFSAVAWLTAKRIAEGLGNNTAIGVIETAWGGTSIQVWLPPSVASACGDAPSYPGGWPTAPSCLFNSMVSPFLTGAALGSPLRAGAFIWYQGESNALNGEAGYYDCALPGLITSWREAFGAGPGAWFGVAQLAPWGTSAASANEWTAELRASQLKPAFSLPNVTVATATDGGDPDAPLSSIHPRAKQAVGNRLGAGALLALYGMGDASDSMGPVAASVVAGGSSNASALSATVSFAGLDAASSPLVLLGPEPVGPYANSSVCPAGISATLCSGFALQDSNGTWYPADGSLTPDGLRLVLTASPPGAPSGAVLNATSSGWSLWPITRLYNSKMVPAYPWRIGVAAKEEGQH